MSNPELITIAAKVLSRARGVTAAAAAGILRDNPEVLAQLRIEVAGMSPDHLAALEMIDSPSAVVAEVPAAPTPAA